MPFFAGIFAAPLRPDKDDQSVSDYAATGNSRQGGRRRQNGTLRAENRHVIYFLQRGQSHHYPQTLEADWNCPAVSGDVASSA